MAVVREEDDLSLLGQLSEDLEAGGCAIVVEVDEEIVDDQRERLGAVKLMLDRGQAESEIELITSAVAHVFDGDLRATGAAANEDDVAAIVEGGGQAGVLLAGEPGEEVAGPSEERSVALLPEAFDLAPEHGDGELQKRVLLGLLARGCLRCLDGRRCLRSSFAAFQLTEERALLPDGLIEPPALLAKLLQTIGEFGDLDFELLELEASNFGGEVTGWRRGDPHHLLLKTAQLGAKRNQLDRTVLGIFQLVQGRATGSVHQALQLVVGRLVLLLGFALLLGQVLQLELDPLELLGVGDGNIE